MLELDSQYKFYDMNESDRKNLIGTCFQTVRKHNNGLFFPIQLANGEFNYGIRQGLIYVSPILKTTKGSKWFRVAASSPDDLDIDLDFGPEYTSLRQEIIQYLFRMNKINVTYRGVLGEIQKHFQAGEITS